MDSVKSRPVGILAVLQVALAVLLLTVVWVGQGRLGTLQGQLDRTGVELRTTKATLADVTARLQATEVERDRLRERVAVLEAALRMEGVDPAVVPTAIPRPARPSPPAASPQARRPSPRPSDRPSAAGSPRPSPRPSPSTRPPSPSPSPSPPCQLPLSAPLPCR